MQDQNPTEPDSSRHFLQIRPKRTLNAINLLVQGNSAPTGQGSPRQSGAIVNSSYVQRAGGAPAITKT